MVYFLVKDEFTLKIVLFTCLYKISYVEKNTESKYLFHTIEKLIRIILIQQL